MGANFSSIFVDPNSLSVQSSSCQNNPSLGDLPEGCVALIIDHLNPQEICKISSLNRAFRGASWADFVWESKLPTNYLSLLERIFGVDYEKFPRKLNKREIFTILSRANTFDGGAKKVWLDKLTGGVCLSVCSKGLAITGIDDRRYWNHIPTEESRFQSIAYLQQIWWLEVDGQFEFPFPAGTYSLFFRLQLGRAAKKFGRRVCNTEHVHGWDIKPVRFQLWTSDGQYASSQCFLNDTGNWDLYHVGDFVVDPSNTSMNLKFSMTQIDCTHTKGGLCLDNVVVYPCTFKERFKHF
ncbi:F-box protein PP2-A12 [Mercurialis annua]|uniref:F-box protein PP2-A12 n=1 Tax=Mercurialis annua TaxID=3986 RepID=UPI00216109D7|nr:F-box protein PP2-A12 [Mercurialis annua]